MTRVCCAACGEFHDDERVHLTAAVELWGHRSIAKTVDPVERGRRNVAAAATRKARTSRIDAINRKSAAPHESLCHAGEHEPSHAKS